MRGLWIASALGSILFLSGCTSPNLIFSYPFRTEDVREAIHRGSPLEGLADLEKHEDSSDAVLYFEEGGRVASFAGDTDLSKKKYETAHQMNKEAWAEPVLSPSEVVGYVGASVVNDNAIPYEAPAYEHIFVNTFQVFNYLDSGDLEGAAVEARRAGNLQREAFHRHRDAIEKAKADAKERKIDLSQSARFQDAYASMRASSSRVKNSFQNAYSFYLSALIWERLGERDNAYIDYKKALDIFPENHYLAYSALRLAREQKRFAAFSELKSRYKHAPALETPEGAGRLVIAVESGFVPPMKEIYIPIFWTDRSYTVALPYYAPGEELLYQGLDVFVQGKRVGGTEPVCWVRDLAVKALLERYPGIALRQVLRLVVKDQIQRQAQSQNDTLGLIAGLASMLTEQADRRSWLTLPEMIHVADFWMEPGMHLVNLGGLGSLGAFEVPVEAGKITVLRVMQPGGHVYAKTLGPL